MTHFNHAFARGDHLVSPRLGYEHHGLYIGHDLVVHYGGLVQGFNKGTICIAGLDEFAQGSGIRVQSHPLRVYDAEDSINRALSRLGEDWYNVLVNNCEHFVMWCIMGIPVSHQVNVAAAGAYGLFEALEKAQAGRELPETVREVVADWATARQAQAVRTVPQTAVAVSAARTVSSLPSSVSTGPEVGEVAVRALGGAAIGAGGAALLSTAVGSGAVTTAATALGVTAAVVSAPALVPMAIGGAVLGTLWSSLFD